MIYISVYSVMHPSDYLCSVFAKTFFSRGLGGGGWVIGAGRGGLLLIRGSETTYVGINHKALFGFKFPKYLVFCSDLYHN